MFLQLSQEPNVARAATDSDNPPKQSGEGWSLLSGLSQSAAIGHVLYYPQEPNLCTVVVIHLYIYYL